MPTYGIFEKNLFAYLASGLVVYKKNTTPPLPNNQTGRCGENDGHKPHVDRKVSYFLNRVNGDVHGASSKVVDENGEPLVVYHGTAGGHQVFTSGFFTTDFEAAMVVAENRAEYVKTTSRGVGVSECPEPVSP